MVAAGQPRRTAAGQPGGQCLAAPAGQEKTRHLQASEERLNTILDTVEACIYIKDRQGRYQYANRKIAELYGMAQATILGLDDSAFFDSHTVAQLRDNDRRVLLDGQRIELEENLCMPGDSRCMST